MDFAKPKIVNRNRKKGFFRIWRPSIFLAPELRVKKIQMGIKVATIERRSGRYLVHTPAGKELFKQYIRLEAAMDEIRRIFENDGARATIPRSSALSNNRAQRIHLGPPPQGGAL